jgi:uncharacterized DUF497 family protein
MIHEIDFEDAATIFEQDVYIEYDIDHSDIEDRWTAYGLLQDAVIRVTFTMKDSGEVYHLISGREAMKNEEKTYYRNRC